MQQLHHATVNGATAEGCARDLLGGVHYIMRFIRGQMRRHRRVGLSVPQFRALVFIDLNEDTSLSALAEHVGLSLPAASRMVDLLVRRGLMQRQARPDNRRSICLSLTAPGKTALRRAFQATQRAMARRFKALSARDLARVSDAMHVLAGVFGPGPPSRAAGKMGV
jgi:DNA-binding MarR family transcriptional regulator